MTSFLIITKLMNAPFVDVIFVTLNLLTFFVDMLKVSHDLLIFIAVVSASMVSCRLWSLRSCLMVTMT